MEQLAFDVDVEVTRSRVTLVDPETGEHGRSWWDSPHGCFTCGLQHDGRDWTHRRPHRDVFLLSESSRYGGLCYCAEHIDAALRQRQAQR